MSAQPATGRTNVIVVVQLVIGCLITMAAIGAWIFAKLNGVETGELMAFVVPVVGALFLVTSVSRAGDAAQQAASQTNGMLDARVKSAVAAALADRDAARTRQSQGDISDSATTPHRQDASTGYRAELTDPTAPR